MAPTGMPPRALPRPPPPSLFGLGPLAGTLLGMLLLSGASRCVFGQTDSGWPVQVQLAGFHLHTTEQPDLKLSELLTPVAQLRRDICLRLGVEPPPGQVHVVLLAGESEYRRYMQHYFPQLPSRRALFIKDHGSGMVFAFRHPELINDLRHECAHAVLQELFPKLPLWLDEGLAEYFEVEPAAVGQHPLHLEHLRDAHLRNAGRTGEDVRNTGRPPVALGREERSRPRHRNRIASLVELEGLTDLRQMGPDQYRHAWLWTSFLLDGPAEGRTALGAYLASLQAHRWTPPLSQRLAAVEPNYHDKFDQHVERLRVADTTAVAAPPPTLGQSHAASTERRSNAAVRPSTSTRFPPDRVDENEPSG